MKKMLSIFTAMVILSSVFTSCIPYAANDPRFSMIAAEPVEKIVVGFAQIGSESDWRVACTNSVKKELSAANGFDLKFVDGKQKQENQINALRSFVEQNVDIIVLSPVVESGWDEVVKEINDAGIPLIIMDRKTDIEGTDYYVTWMGSNFIEEGEKAGKWLIDYMDGVNRGGDDINIAELYGTIGSSPAIDRHQGFLDALAGKTTFVRDVEARPNFKIVMSESGDFEQANGKEVMKSFLAESREKNIKIDVLFAHNDNMALGAIEAIKEAGMKPGEDIIIVGVDAVKGAFVAMAAGEMNCTVECSPLLGPQLAFNCKAIMEGKTLEKITYVIEGVYPQEVAAKELPNRVY